MSILNNLMSSVAAAVESSTVADMTQLQKGGGERKVFPEGTTLARLVGVIELGKRPVEFQGQAKAPQPHVMLQFAMFSQGYTYDEEGKQPGVIGTPDMTLTFTDKSKVRKLFARMNYKGTHKHFAQMLGEVFLLSIKHNKKDDKVYVNIDLDSILPPQDPLTKQPYACPEAPESYYRLLLWDAPTKEQWESLIIKDQEGKPIEKQWLQEKVVEALDYNTSALYTVLHGSLPPLAAVPKGTDPASVPAAPAATPAAVPPSAPAFAVPVAPAAVPVPPAPVAA